MCDCYFLSVCLFVSGVFDVTTLYTRPREMFDAMCNVPIEPELWLFLIFNITDQIDTNIIHVYVKAPMNLQVSKQFTLAILYYRKHINYYAGNGQRSSFQAVWWQHGYVYVLPKHTEAWTKWLTFWVPYSEMHFLQRICVVFRLK